MDLFLTVINLLAISFHKIIVDTVHSYHALQRDLHNREKKSYRIRNNK